jgi:hypothetical protein
LQPLTSAELRGASPRSADSKSRQVTDYTVVRPVRLRNLWKNTPPLFFELLISGGGGCILNILRRFI